VKNDLDLLSNADRVGITVDDVRHHARTFLQLHVGEDVYSRVAVRGQVRLTTTIDRETVDRSAT
jgi:hypothetical protein